MCIYLFYIIVYQCLPHKSSLVFVADIMEVVPTQDVHDKSTNFFIYK